MRSAGPLAATHDFALAGAGVIAVTVTGKLVCWLAAHGYIDEDMAEDAAEQAREASRDLPMANRLANLLHE